MNRKKTHKEYVAEVAKIHPNIEVLGTYVDNKTNILHRCIIDGNEWYARPGNVLQGCGCKKCSNNRLSEMKKMSHNDYIAKLNYINPNIQVVETYINSSTPILHRCRIDNNEWYVKPSHVLSGHGCPMCSKNKRKTQQEYVDEVSELNSNIDVIGEYINDATAIIHKCKIDGTEWFAKPTHILRGTGCPMCNCSHGENIILKYLQKKNINFFHQKRFDECKDTKALPFDFYIPNLNVCIEYDGIQHFQPIDFAGNGQDWAIKQFNLIKKHDAIKNNFCNIHNIYLLRIKYDDDIESVLDNFFNNNMKALN